MNNDCEKNQEYAFAYCKIITDENGKLVDYEFIQVNDAFESLTGCKIIDVVGKKASEIQPNFVFSKDGWLSKYRTAIVNRKRVTFEYFFEPLQRWFWVDILPIEDHDFIVVFIDISNSKESERLLRKTEEKYQYNFEKLSNNNSDEKYKIMFDNSPEAYYLCDINGNFIDCNKATEKLFGYTREDLIGKNILTLGLLPTINFPKAVTILAKSVLGIPNGPDIFAVKRKDGYEVHVEVITTTLQLSNQTVVFAIGREVMVNKKNILGVKKTKKEISDHV